jgi:magnesium chelatase subunit I
MEAEALRPVDDDFETVVPEYMKEIVAEVSRLARRSPDVSQRSGVSVRASVANYEALLANALRRAIRLGDSVVVPRISDLPFVLPSLQGKVEFETVEEGKDEQILDRLIQGAVVSTFNRILGDADTETVVESFKSGLSVETGESMPAAEYLKLLRSIEGLAEVVGQVTSDERPEVQASAVEFVLEGLHLNKRLNKDRVGAQALYRG